jgi:hypothetical protein
MSNLVHDHELRELIADLDATAELLGALHDDRPDDGLVEAQNAIERAAHYLENLRFKAHCGEQRRLSRLTT